MAIEYPKSVLVVPSEAVSLGILGQVPRPAGTGLHEHVARTFFSVTAYSRRGRPTTMVSPLIATSSRRRRGLPHRRQSASPPGSRLTSHWSVSRTRRPRLHKRYRLQ